VDPISSCCYSTVWSFVPVVVLLNIPVVSQLLLVEPAQVAAIVMNNIPVIVLLSIVSLLLLVETALVAALIMTYIHVVVLLSTQQYHITAVPCSTWSGCSYIND
jgi:hypothetical protein